MSKVLHVNRLFRGVFGDSIETGSWAVPRTNTDQVNSHRPSPKPAATNVSSCRAKSDNSRRSLLVKMVVNEGV